MISTSGIEMRVHGVESSFRISVDEPQDLTWFGRSQIWLNNRHFNDCDGILNERILRLQITQKLTGYQWAASWSEVERYGLFGWNSEQEAGLESVVHVHRFVSQLCGAVPKLRAQRNGWVKSKRYNKSMSRLTNSGDTFASGHISDGVMTL